MAQKGVSFVEATERECRNSTLIPT